MRLTLVSIRVRDSREIPEKVNVTTLIGVKDEPFVRPSINFPFRMTLQTYPKVYLKKTFILISVFLLPYDKF